MAFWKRKADKVFWRDHKNNIVCPKEDKCVKCDESCPIHLNTIGIELLQQDRFIEAIESFRAALLLAPDFVDAQNNLGAAYGANGQHEEAYIAYKKSTKMNPRYPNSWRGLAISSRKLGRLDEAIECCRQLERLGAPITAFKEDVEKQLLNSGKQKETSL